ncbi:hypothetical protein EGY16_37245 [Burkholderia pseudomallei]|nr:hypothetical protein EGY16_37245 [Burkholderia pseudomallei]EDO88448.1 hypothetical protein BURPS406E_D0204 [Burkholderia pseudomallei 406e]EEC34682.1 hypothetical protein BUC_7087 [Burkholderia pseudomallei 576]EEH29950.1 hypothetical protein BUH_7184 [Burkholderia pseudomallei Pakistan 9]KGX51826.1 hypothetical protein Y027_5114 [Burkholderia pseudomallei TSV5]
MQFIANLLQKPYGRIRIDNVLAGIFKKDRNINNHSCKTVIFHSMKFTLISSKSDHPLHCNHFFDR